jgi:hypothetical protein
MVRFFEWLTELLMRRSKKPWGRFTVGGITEDNQIRFEIAYNKALLKNIKANGLEGETDEDTINNFLFATVMYPKQYEDTVDPVQSDFHPNLSSADNKFKV